MELPSSLVIPILTVETARLFHEKVRKLAERTDEPRLPINYRDLPVKKSREGYLLLHEEEQHLADNIAFLAHTKDDPSAVSAVTIEQVDEPPSLTVRLAANKTPTQAVITGLRRVLGAVATYARNGDRESSLATIFGLVIELNKNRLQGRIWSSTGYKRRKSLGVLLRRLSQNLPQEPLCELKSKLESTAALIAKYNSPSSQSLDVLKQIVNSLWGITHHDSAKSFETYLQSKGLQESIYESPTVRNVDKISRYLDVCKDFIRFGRSRRLRSLFRNIRLEHCIAYPHRRPDGATASCVVHGEVQLILYYEQHPFSPPPRAIGSSKSACFLCDLLIVKHGEYSISHSHQRLYTKWTIPEMTTWMRTEQVSTYERLFVEINKELSALIKAFPKRQFFSGRNGPESRLHLLTLPPGVSFSPTESYISGRDSKNVDHRSGSQLATMFNMLGHPISSPKPAIDNPRDSKFSVAPSSLSKIQDASQSENEISRPPNASYVLPRRSSQPSSTQISKNAVATYHISDLPFTLDIDGSTASFVLFVDHAEYIFDLESVQSGQLHIADDRTREETKVHVGDLSSLVETRLQIQPNKQTLAFRLVDRSGQDILVVIKWI